MSTRDITIQGHVFAAPAPYVAGHALTEIEAGVLNQCFGENLRNNFASTIAKFRQDNGYGTTAMVDGKEVWTDDKTQVLSEEHLAELRTAFADYAKDYSFASSGGGRRGPADPVKDMALALTRAKVAATASSQGRTITKARLNELAEKLYEAKTEEYRAKAEVELRKAKKAAENDDLGEDFFAE